MRAKTRCLKSEVDRPIPSKQDSPDGNAADCSDHRENNTCTQEIVTARASIGAEIRALRRSMNLNQTEFAEKVGLSIGTISKIEHGKTAASLDTLISMAQILNVSFLSFFEGLEEKQPCHVILAGEGIRISRENCLDNALHQLKGQWISESGLTELHFVSLECGSTPWFNRHEGWAILYALAGRFRYRHGQRILVLQPGDAVHFDASCLHGPELVEQHPASYVLIRVNPSVKVQRSRKPTGRA